MKVFIKYILLIITLLTHFCFCLNAEPATPDMVIYGQARNSFGFPYIADDNAEVVLRNSNGEEVLRRKIGTVISPGVNFVLHVPMDLGYLIQNVIDLGRYRDNAFRETEDLLISVSENGNEIPVIEYGSQNLKTSATGTFLQVDLTTGTDADGDGIPDEWELFIIADDETDSLSSIEDVLATDDYDADGLTNLAEFHSLTLPNWNLDSFRIIFFDQLDNQQYRLFFLSKPGKSYEVYSSTDLSNWDRVSVSDTKDGDEQDYFTEESFFIRRLFVGPFDDDGVERYFRMTVK